MEGAQGSLKAKKKLKLAIPIEENPANKLIPIEGTTSFLLIGAIKRTGEAKGSSSSASKSQKSFFKRSDSKDFDDEGRFYFVRGRNNGKIMEDKVSFTILGSNSFISTKYTVIPEFEGIENCSFYGVYDGHSTVTIAEMLKEKLHDYIIESYRQQGSISQAYFEGKRS